MSDSLLKGTTWYWRQGLKEAHADRHIDFVDVTKTKELYMPVRDATHAQAVMDELQQNGITTERKITHSPYDVVPKGSLIVFGAVPLAGSLESEQENMKKLKTYIQANGGRIEEGGRPLSSFKMFMKNLFGRG